jgi:hypothetical protein
MNRPVRTAALVVVLLTATLAVAGTPATAASGTTLSLNAAASAGGPTETATITATVTNTGKRPTGVIVTIEERPERWTIRERADAGGVWNPAAEKWLFQRVEPEETVSPNVTLAIPPNASGQHDVTVSATDATTNLSASASMQTGTGLGSIQPGGSVGLVTAWLELLAGPILVFTLVFLWRKRR